MFPCLSVVVFCRIMFTLGKQGVSAPHTDESNKIPWGLAYTCAGMSARTWIGQLFSQLSQNHVNTGACVSGSLTDKEFLIYLK